MTLVEPVEPLLPGFRSNDGKIDYGRAALVEAPWTTMAAGARGFVYRRDPGRPSVRVEAGIHIANTISAARTADLLPLRFRPPDDLRPSVSIP